MIAAVPGDLWCQQQAEDCDWIDAKPFAAAKPSDFKQNLINLWRIVIINHAIDMLFKRTLWPCQEREIQGICEVWLRWQKNALWGWVDLGGSVSCDMVLSKLMSWEDARATLQKAIDDDKAWVFLNSIFSSFKITCRHTFSLCNVSFWL